MSGPAYTRLTNDERRSRLLELGADLFTRFSYDELSMAKIAREAGISKALLYHYFPSKQEFFSATLSETAQEVLALTQPDPDLPPAQALAASLDAYLAWIEEHADGYMKLLLSATGAPEVRELIDGVRAQTATRVLEGLYPDGDAPSAVRSAVRGWLLFIDGAVLEWLEHDDLARDQVLGLILGTLLGAITAAGAGDALTALMPPA